MKLIKIVKIRMSDAIDINFYLWIWLVKRFRNGQFPIFK